MGKRGSIMGKVYREMRSKRINPIFPTIAHTTMQLRANGTFTATFVNGHELIGFTKANSIFDPLGSLPAVPQDGAVDADSILQPSGYDELDLIYDSYYVNGFTMSVRLTDNHDYKHIFTDEDTSGEGWTTNDSMRQDKGHIFYLCVIPSPTSTEPAQTYLEVMNHPFMTKVEMLTSNTHVKKSPWLNVAIPNCDAFMGATMNRDRDGGTGSETRGEYVAFAADPASADNLVFLHYFILHGIATADSTHEFGLDYKWRGKVSLSRFAAVPDNTLVTDLGNSYAPGEQ